LRGNCVPDEMDTFEKLCYCILSDNKDLVVANLPKKLGALPLFFELCLMWSEKGLSFDNDSLKPPPYENGLQIRVPRRRNMVIFPCGM